MVSAVPERSTTERESWRLYATVMDASPDCVLISDPETHHFLYANDTACRMTGFSQAELLKIPGYKILRRSREEAAKSFDEAIAAGAEGITDEVYLLASKDGTRRGWWETHRRAVQVEGRWLIITVAREVTSRILAEQALERSKRMYAALSATNEALIHAKSADELYQGVCDALVNAGGLGFAGLLLADDNNGRLRPATMASVDHKCLIWPDEAVSNRQSLIGLAYQDGETYITTDVVSDTRARAWHAMAREHKLKSAASVPVIRAGKTIGVLLLCSHQRRTFDDEIAGLLQNIAENLVFGLVNLEQELERERAEERVRFLATHDSLTGLPNRTLFAELLDQAAATARRHKNRLGVMFIDLDRFKLVNDTLGHAAGDILLKEMACRLKSVMRESDVLARLGGDEFVVLLQDLDSAQDATIVARKLLEAALKPVEILDQECRVSASIGISLFPDDGQEHLELMKNADTAMYMAKQKGKNGYALYHPNMNSPSNERLALETALRNALANDEFSLHYQAKLDLKTDAINGVEALLRWHSPRLGEVPPERFIPLCEESGSIVPIGRWVLRKACEQNMAWQRQGLPPLTMAVNLSTQQFSDPGLVGEIENALDASGMDATLLELEITERMVMLDPARTVETLTKLRALGVRVVLDDFGVGYSSLTRIKDFPIDTIKVDRSFVRNLPENDQSRAITAAIVSMARTLSLRVVAEGVETQAQESYLRDLACDESQGFYFGKPVPAEELTALVTTHSPQPKK